MAAIAKLVALALVVPAMLALGMLVGRWLKRD